MRKFAEFIYNSSFVVFCLALGSSVYSFIIILVNASKGEKVDELVIIPFLLFLGSVIFGVCSCVAKVCAIYLEKNTDEYDRRVLQRFKQRKAWKYPQNMSPANNGVGYQPQNGNIGLQNSQQPHLERPL